MRNVVKGVGTKANLGARGDIKASSLDLGENFKAK